MRLAAGAVDSIIERHSIFVRDESVDITSVTSSLLKKS
jgi:hypothetical protein